MRPQQFQNLVLIGLLAVLAIGIGVAYWFGGDRGSAAASGPVEPVKKFRAEPGTERENARALVSSVPSVPEETTDRPIEIWGSLDEDDGTEQSEFNSVRGSIEGLSAEQAKDQIAEQLNSAEVPADERAQLEASLALALLDADEPDPEGARSAFARAYKLCADANSRVQLAQDYAPLLYKRGHYEETLEFLDEGRFVGADFSAPRLVLEAIRGITLDALGRDAAARDAYRRAFLSAMRSDLDKSAQGRDAARLIALRLARHYRADGRPEDAIAVVRMLRGWLGEEDLILR